MEGVQRPPGGCEIRGELRLGPGDGDLLQHEPFDIVGNRPWHIQLDLRRLLRAVLWVACDEITLRRDRACQPARSSRIRGGDYGMTESSIANTAQQEFWNNVAGPRWVGLGGLVERRVRAVNDLLLARSEVAAVESVLEIGCGTGAATVPFAKAVGERGRVVGVDISEPMLAGARKHRLGD